jgi:membrane-bound lytic murein transglycosylase D
MGRYLLRRAAVALLAALAAAPAGLAAEGQPRVAPLPSAGFVRRVTAAAAPGTESPPRLPQALPAAPLPAEHSHGGDELFAIDAPDEPVIESFSRAFLETKRDWLEAVLVRTLLYREVIADRIQALGLPPELLFLPAIESGFQVKATSPRGAAGLWQLMRNTAGPLGLVMDPWIDERRDFWKATEVSLSKLAADRRAFGSWPLALAAYNCGSGRLSRIIRESGTSDYWELRRRGRLPRETASFVPQFLAVSRILASPVRYGLTASWDPRPSWERVPVNGCVDLGVLSLRSGVPLAVLAAGNAELSMGITPPASYGYRLKVPREYREAVEATIDGAALPLLEFRLHTVRRGDTLSGIARVYGVTPAMISDLNPAARPQALRIGSTLLVPVRGRAQGSRPPAGEGGSG